MRFVNKAFTNKRKKNIFYNNFNIIFLFSFIFLFLIITYFNISLIKSQTISLIENFSHKYDYQLMQVDISDLKYLEEEDILVFFDPYINKSIFLAPIESIAKNIAKIKWVEKIKIVSNFKDTLKVSIQEETPLGIYDNDNQKILFSQNLVILNVLDKNKNFLNLTNFSGENSIPNSKQLVSIIGKNFFELVRTATYIENRRWNIKLKNSILLKLPEKNIVDALKNYKKIYANFSNKDLEDIKSIDLRINKQATIKYKNKL